MSKVYRDNRGDWDDLVIEDLGDIATAKLSEVGEALGFAWEDVDLLRKAKVLQEFGPDWNRTVDLHDLADRIAALLPPREG